MGQWTQIFKPFADVFASWEPWQVILCVVVGIVAWKSPALIREIGRYVIASRRLDQKQRDGLTRMQNQRNDHRVIEHKEQQALPPPAVEVKQRPKHRKDRRS